MAAPNRRPIYDTSGTGGNADAHYGRWRGSDGQTVTGGNGTGGNIQMPACCADANIKMTDDRRAISFPLFEPNFLLCRGTRVHRIMGLIL
ncbi:uncharacterized protein AtWU_07492 [Aspergillus tubingensis]|uniref:uncharacterized protein n=1 Tax=Aspergillus tubingensis TaxID=5068 RepID=UPI0015785A46|nr:uncharacterized protein AtWU_07492 [Aspergillus tubingensis]GFN17690.1 hypothetical protein AtWU_07492 [Aspergillus tubingensis]